MGIEGKKERALVDEVMAASLMRPMLLRIHPPMNSATMIAAFSARARDSRERRCS
jgi:hypothetical protein